MPTDTPTPTATPTNTATPTVAPTPKPSTVGHVVGNSRFGSKKQKESVFFQFWIGYQKGNSAPKGNFTYTDPKAHLTLKATSFEQLVINGSQATFSGLATVNGRKNVWFEVTVIDSRKRGAKDGFMIRIPSLDD
jgi:hypothetical protein